MSNDPNPCLSKTYTSCVFYTGTTYTTADDGIEICLGKSLNTILETIIDRILSIEDTCTVKVSSTDECCGYLAEKLVSDTLEFTTVTDEDTNCQTLSVDIPAPDWEAVTFGSTFSNQGVEAARASVDGLGKVELRGRVTGSSVTTTTTVTTLGTAFRPTDTRFINVNVNNSGNYYPGVIQIQSNGVVSILCNTSGWTGTSGTFSINGYFWKDA
jgi:hypothetical protein